VSPKDPDELGHWKSPAAEATFRRLVDELVGETWPTALETTEIATRFGSVVVRSADGTGEPVVLLPGFGAPAEMHGPDLLEGLAGRPYHLVETLGDVGPSVQTAPIRDADDEAAWLIEVLDGLGLRRADLVGSSLGVYRIMNLAVRDPARVRSIVGIEPATARPGSRFLRHGFAVLLASMAPMPARRRAAARLHMPGLDDRRLTKVGRLAYTKHVSGHPRPAWLDDEQLASIRVPSLFVLAEASELHDADAVADRLRRTMPTADVVVVPNAGHSLPMSHPALVGHHIGAFLDALGRRPAAPTG
jgi:pimeloyl-ACP methyl ester carboxylesterase